MHLAKLCLKKYQVVLPGYTFVLLMKKGHFLFFMFVALLTLYSSNGIAQHVVSLNAHFPDSIMAGEEFKTGFTLKHDEAISFARLQINIPEGFIPLNQTKGSAQFAHSKNNIKWIWISLGDAGEKKLEVTFVSLKNMQGDFIFTPSFSYADEDSSVHINFAPVKLFLKPYIEKIPLASADIKTETAPSTKEKYTVQIVAKRENNPEAVRTYLKQKGIKEQAFSFSEGGLYKFCLGRFTSPEKAEEYKQKLASSKGMSDVFVRVIPE